MNEFKRVIDPTKISEDDLPLIVLSDFSAGFIAFLIKFRTKASYNHIMMAHKPGRLASQGLLYRDIKIEEFMRDGNRLKFWKIKNLDKDKRKAILEKIDRELKASWHKRLYDFPGILGQAVGLNWFNSPFTNYCSEKVANDLKIVWPGIPSHPSPHALDIYLKARNDLFEVYGYWWEDL